MKNKTAEEVAKNINEDRQGSDYYNDPDVLAPYLKNSLNVSEDTAQEIAKHILEDRDGADYYQDVEVLSQYLEGQME